MAVSRGYHLVALTANSYTYIRAVIYWSANEGAFCISGLEGERARVVVKG